MYIYDQGDWPNFYWDQEKISALLIQLRHLQGKLIGGMESIGFHTRDEAVLETLTQDVVKSSEIEGEILDPSSVRSSVARHLGMDIGAIPRLAQKWELGPTRKLSRFNCFSEGSIDLIQPSEKQLNPEALARSKFPLLGESGYVSKEDRNIDGVVEMILDATQKFDQPLTKNRLFKWHQSLFPNGRSGFSKIKVGAWRTGPVDVISGFMGKTKVHFEAPSAERVDHEMDLFLEWLNHAIPIDPVLKAAIAHLWFVTIHPFEDGNGRIARAIGDLMLARSENSSHRFYSLSAQIQKERKSYYTILEQTQKGRLEITPWLDWLISCLRRAIENALLTLNKVLINKQFWESISEVSLNERQRKIIARMLDNFNGKLTTSKWAKMAKCSQDTAHRDILDLIQKGILQKNLEGGRSTSYSIKFKDYPLLHDLRPLRD